MIHQLSIRRDLILSTKQAILYSVSQALCHYKLQCPIWNSRRFKCVILFCLISLVQSLPAVPLLHGRKRGEALIVICGLGTLLGRRTEQRLIKTYL